MRFLLHSVGNAQAVAREMLVSHARSVAADALRWSVRAFDKDSLRRFLVFATGSPGLPSAPGFEIQVRAQPRSPALPVAHTCFFHLDIPDYADEGEFVAKLTTAILECGTFDRV